MNKVERQYIGVAMGIIALVGFAIIGGAAWQSHMDAKRWFIAAVGAVICLILLLGAIAETFTKEEEKS